VIQEPLDLARVFDLEPHGPDTYVGESPPYPWGRVYGGLVVAQALWAAIQTVAPEQSVHSLHAYFILGGDLREPIRYEVDRIRNGRSFSTRRVVARQSAGAILTLACSFHKPEQGASTQTSIFPADVPRPDALKVEYDAGALRAEAPGTTDPPRSQVWVRYPGALPDDPRLQSCVLAYVSDLSPMSAALTAHPNWKPGIVEWDEQFMGASLDHSMWFHRPVDPTDWHLLDFTCQGNLENRALANGPIFSGDGRHVASVSQEVLLREVRPRGQG
jgi:acyl-CoA thioesterase-2